MAAKDVVGVQAGPPTGVGTSCVGIWAPSSRSAAGRVPIDPDLTIERLGRKVEKKLAQARSAETRVRIVIVDAWEVDYLKAAGEKASQRLRGKLVSAHANVGAVLLTHRRWIDGKLRHSYPLTALVGDAPQSALALLLERVLSIDAA